MSSVLTPDINGGTSVNVKRPDYASSNTINGGNAAANYTIENALRNVSDPVRGFRFLVDFPVLTAIFGGMTTTFNVDTLPLTETVKSIDLPSWTIDQLQVRFMNDKSNHAGRKEYSDTFSITFRDTADGSVWSFLDAWSEMISATDPRIVGSGSSLLGTKAKYGTDCVITTLDYDGFNVVKSEILTGVWPQNKAAITKDYDTSSLVERTITFSFDKYLPLKTTVS